MKIAGAKIFFGLIFIPLVGFSQPRYFFADIFQESYELVLDTSVSKYLNDTLLKNNNLVITIVENLGTASVEQGDIHLINNIKVKYTTLTALNCTKGDLVLYLSNFELFGDYLNLTFTTAIFMDDCTFQQVDIPTAVCFKYVKRKNSWVYQTRFPEDIYYESGINQAKGKLKHP